MPAARPSQGRHGRPTTVPVRGDVLPSDTCGTGHEYAGQLGLLAAIKNAQRRRPLWLQRSRDSTGNPCGNPVVATVPVAM